MGEILRYEMVKTYPAVREVLKKLPAIFSRALDPTVERYDLSRPYLIDGHIAATNARLMVWIPATEPLASEVESLPGYRPRPEPRKTLADYMAKADFGDPIPLSRLRDDAPVCKECEGKGTVDWIECGCCGERTHVEGLAFECSGCDGTGAAGGHPIEIADTGVFIDIRYALWLEQMGAVVRVSTKPKPEAEAVQFLAPGGITGLVMPMEAARAREIRRAEALDHA